MSSLATEPAASGLELADLSLLEPDQLERLYREARAPELERIDGDLRGRMLAVVALPGPLRRLARRAAGARWFPWRGKSFRPLGAGAGEGINRVVRDAWRWYRFTTALGPSRAGPFAAVQLDYDHPENPAFIRAIKDEVRELRPGLLLGQAWLVVRGRARLVLWFGLERDRS